MRAPSWPSSQRGFSLLELGVALAVLGVLGLLMMRGYGGSGDRVALTHARAELQRASDAVHAFALARHRLPCPDTNGNGREGDASGACGTGASVGGLPWLALDLSRPRGELRYGVYRAAGADLAGAAAVASGGDPRSGHGALLQALAAAAASVPSDTQPYLTGDDGALGGADCSAAPTSNPAFVLAAGGADRSGNGSIWDAPHASTISLCFAPPSRPAAHAYDDLVQAVPAQALLGWLRAHTR